MRKNAALGVILSKDRSYVLLVKRQDVPVWVLPGGGIEAGEKSEDAVLREVNEETGLKVEITRKIAEYSPINQLACFTELYECHAIEGSLQEGEETRAINFFPIDNLPKNLFFLHKEWLEETLQNHTYIIQRKLNNVTYWNFAKFFLRHPHWVLRFLYTMVTKT